MRNEEANYLIIAGHRRCGTTYLHDIFNAIEGISVLSKKEDSRVLDNIYLRSNDFNSLLTSAPSKVAVIIHPQLVFHPDCIHKVVKSCERAVIVFLRRDPYERAKSEFRMLCSIAPSASTSRLVINSLATEAIAHSQYEELESAVQNRCANTSIVRIAYRTALAEPLKLLEALGVDVSSYEESFNQVLSNNIYLDRNLSNLRFPLRSGLSALVAKKIYSGMINGSVISYKLAKYFKNSTIGRLMMTRLRDKDININGLFEDIWRERVEQQTSKTSTKL